MVDARLREWLAFFLQAQDVLTSSVLRRVKCELQCLGSDVIYNSTKEKQTNQYFEALKFIAFQKVET